MCEKDESNLKLIIPYMEDSLGGPPLSGDESVFKLFQNRLHPASWTGAVPIPSKLNKSKSALSKIRNFVILVVAKQWFIYRRHASADGRSLIRNRLSRH